MPVKRKSDSQRAEEMRQKAMALQNRGMQQELAQISKNRPDLVPLLLQHAYALGAPRNLEEGRMLADSPAKSQLALCDATAHDEEAPSSGSGYKRGDVQPIIPRCFQDWGHCPPQYLLHILSEVEPISLGSGALRQLCPTKSKHIPKVALNNLFERVCNFGTWRQHHHKSAKSPNYG